MRRFRFRLQRLERLREERHRRARAELASALNRLRRCRRRRETLERAVEDARGCEDNPFRTCAGADRPSDDLREWSSYLDRLREAIEDATRLELAALDDARFAAQRYIEAARDHKVVERLRERRFRRWLEEAARIEQRFLDEIDILRRVRTSKEASG